jgi:hypothetical protein
MTLYGHERFACAHRDCDCTLMEDEGYVICARCGAVITRRVTRARFARLLPYSLDRYPFSARPG